MNALVLAERERNSFTVLRGRRTRGSISNQLGWIRLSTARGADTFFATRSVMSGKEENVTRFRIICPTHLCVGGRRTFWFSPNARADLCCPTRTAHKKSFRGLLVNPHDQRGKGLASYSLSGLSLVFKARLTMKKIYVVHLRALPLIR